MALASHPRGVPRPRRAATALQAACMLGPWLRAPRGLAARAQGHASVPTQACHGLGCVPWPWLLHACMPRPWQLHAHGVLPRPWLRHVHALAACPWGVALALAAACPGLGCLPMGGCLGLRCCVPWPWLPAHGGCLGLRCCMPWAGSGHPRGMPACTPRRIAPHRPAL